MLNTVILTIVSLTTYTLSKNSVTICSTSLNSKRNYSKSYLQFITITKPNNTLTKDSFSELSISNLINEIKIVVIETDYINELISLINLYEHNKDNENFSKLEFLNESLSIILNNSNSIQMNAFSYISDTSQQTMSSPYENKLYLKDSKFLNTTKLTSSNKYDNAFEIIINIMSKNGGIRSIYSVLQLETILKDDKLSSILTQHFFEDLMSKSSEYCTKVSTYDDIIKYESIDYIMEYYARLVPQTGNLEISDNKEFGVNRKDLTLYKVDIDRNIEQYNADSSNDGLDENLILGTCYFIVFCCLSFFGIYYCNKIKKSSKSLYRKVKRRLSKRYYPIDMKNYEKRKSKKYKEEEEFENERW